MRNFRFTRNLIIICLVFGLAFFFMPMAASSDDEQISEANVVVAGDLLCLAGQLSAAKNGSSWNFDYVFKNISPIIKSADFSIANLETSVGGKEMGVTKYNQEGNPIINAPVEFLDSVKKAGFQYLVTANNHSFDLKDEGREKTIKILDRYGFYHGGTYLSEYYRDNISIVRVNGISIAILPYTQMVNTGTEAYKKTGKMYKLNLIDFDLIEKDIKEARRRNADIVLLYVHWGKENVQTANAYQKETARKLAELGADVIIGSHSHTVQPAEFIDTPDGRKVFVIYSMGNFISSMARDINQDALLLNLHMTKKDGKSYIDKITYMCITNGMEGGKLYAALPSRIMIEKGRQVSKMNGSINRTLAVINGVIDEVDCFDYVVWE